MCIATIDDTQFGFLISEDGSVRDGEEVSFGDSKYSVSKNQIVFGYYNFIESKLHPVHTFNFKESTEISELFRKNIFQEFIKLVMNSDLIKT